MGYSEILRWLNGHSSYADGVGLFRAHGNNSTLLKLFEQGENSFTREELRDALSNVVECAAQKESPQPLPTSKPLPVFPASSDFEPLSEKVWFKIDVEKLPPELKQLWKKKSAITEEQKALFYRLELFTKDEDRLRASLRILEIEDERQAMWQVFNKWHETGEFEQPEQANEPTREELKKKVRQLTVRISKLGKRPNMKPKRDALIQERAAINKKLADGTV